MSAFAEKKARLQDKKARHLENIEATKQKIVEVDAKIALCDRGIAAEKAAAEKATATTTNDGTTAP